MAELAVIVCGGRAYNDHDHVYKTLNKILPNILIHGGAGGADSLASNWASLMRDVVKQICCPADWETYGKRAGYMRNSDMLVKLLALADRGYEIKVIAFPGGRGTDMMKRLARDAGVTVEEV